MKTKTYKQSFYLKIVLALILVIAMSIGSFSLDSFATSNDITQTAYEETHDQINFENLMIVLVDNENLLVDVDPTVSIFKRSNAETQKEKYDNYIANVPHAEKELANAIKDGENICALSYTIAPVVFVDNHFERIPKGNDESRSVTTESYPSYRNNLTLCTRLTISGSSNPYTYTAVTYGTWDNEASTLIGGEQSPASGYDYVLQACPTVTSSTSFSSTYNYSTNGSTYGQNGINYFLADGGNSWVKYEIVDDPLGIAQLHTFYCTQTFSAISTSATKKINSYYVHTWDTISISVTTSGSAGTSEGYPAASVELSITPSIVEKSWQLYNPLSYSF